MPEIKKVKLKNGVGEYVYPEIDPGDAGGAFVITYTRSGSTFTGDKTWEQAFTAFASGQCVLNHFIDSEGSEYYSSVDCMRKIDDIGVDYYMMDSAGNTVVMLFQISIEDWSSSGTIEFYEAIK